ncbi:hypothetical protein SAMN05421505_13628 [Sinosporangium album]|uniref:Uncharacterized protein n=1 Tax=Sinosporangium album TaxID=504805 RepID=A0A1G8IAX1_9ACTN|nr:hypothetical protein SAMN05421505_13628 [Sinosporangium album]
MPFTFIVKVIVRICRKVLGYCFRYLDHESWRGTVFEYLYINVASAFTASGSGNLALIAEYVFYDILDLYARYVVLAPPVEEGVHTLPFP